MEKSRQGQATRGLVVWWAKTAVNVAVGLVLLGYWADAGFTLAAGFIALVIGSILVSINGAGAPPWIDRE